MSNELLSSGEVAELFGVHSKTVARWADDGKIKVLRTLGGHRRFRREDVEELLAEQDAPEPTNP